jgi:hypothetical protein
VDWSYDWSSGLKIVQVMGALGLSLRIQARLASVLGGKYESKSTPFGSYAE